MPYYINKTTPVFAEKAMSPGNMETRDGTISYAAGDYLVTGSDGERYPVPRDAFEEAHQLHGSTCKVPLEMVAKAALKELTALWSFYGTGLMVTNWHKNGEVEPLDAFFEDNDCGALELLERALGQNLFPGGNSPKCKVTRT